MSCPGWFLSSRQDQSRDSGLLRLWAVFCPTLLPCLRLCSQTLSCLSCRICKSSKSGWWVEMLRELLAGAQGRASGSHYPWLSAGMVYLPRETQWLEVGKPVCSGLLLRGSHLLGLMIQLFFRITNAGTRLVALGWLTASASVPQLWRTLGMPGVGSRDTEGSWGSRALNLPTPYLVLGKTRATSQEKGF